MSAACAADISVQRARCMRPDRRQFLRLLWLGLASLALRRQGAAAEPMHTSYPISDHFDGRRFFNPGGGDPRGLGALLRWQFNRRPGAWPKWIENKPIFCSMAARNMWSN